LGGGSVGTPQMTPLFAMSVRTATSCSAYFFRLTTSLIVGTDLVGGRVWGLFVCRPCGWRSATHTTAGATGRGPTGHGSTSDGYRRRHLRWSLQPRRRRRTTAWNTQSVQPTIKQNAQLPLGWADRTAHIRRSNLRSRYKSDFPEWLHYSLVHAMARASLREWRTKGVHGPSKIYDFNFFPVNRTSETALLLQEQYVTWTKTPSIIYWNDATALWWRCYIESCNKH